MSLLQRNDGKERIGRVMDEMDDIKEEKQPDQLEMMARQPSTENNPFASERRSNAVYSHQGHVFSVAWSPDGKFYASASVDKKVCVYTSRDGVRLHVLDHNAAVVRVTFSPDSSLVATACSDGVICIWAASNGMLFHTFSEHTRTVADIQFSPDGLLLASASDDDTAIIWDVEQGASKHVLDDHAQPVRTLAWSPNGTMLATGSLDSSVVLWDVETGRPRFVLEGHAGAVRDVGFSHSGHRVASVCNQGQLIVWGTASGDKQADVQAHDDGATQLVFAADRILTSGLDGMIRIWTPTAHLIHDLPGHTGGVGVLEVSPDGSSIASAGADATVRLWRVDTGAATQVLTGHTATVYSVAFSPDGARLVTASEDHSIRLWNPSSEALVNRSFVHSDAINDLILSPDGSFFASCSEDGTLALYDMNGQCTRQFRSFKKPVNALVFSPDSKYIAGASDDHDIRVWDLDTGRCLYVLKGHTDNVNVLAWSPLGRLLVSGGQDGKLGVWDTKTGENVHLLSENGAVLCLDFSRVDENLLACGTSGRTVSIWNVTKGTTAAALTGHGGAVNVVRFSSDGSALASGSDDLHPGEVASDSLFVWDVQSGTRKHVLQGHTDSITDVHFVKGAKTLVSSSNDATVRGWTLANGKLKTTLDVPSSVRKLVVARLQDDTHLLIAGTADGTIFAWDSSFNFLRTMDGHKKNVTAMVWNRDTSTLLSGDAAGHVLLWDDPTLQLDFHTCQGYLARKDFDMITLQSWVERWPTLVNLTANDGTTLFHWICRQRREDLLAVLINSPAYVGFTARVDGTSPIDICLNNKANACLTALLESVRRIPLDNRAVVTNSLSRLSRDNPEALEEFLDDFELEPADPIVRGGVDEYALDDGQALRVGSDLARPIGLWSKYAQSHQGWKWGQPKGLLRQSSSLFALDDDDTPVTAYICGLPGLASFYSMDDRNNNPIRILIQEGLVNVLGSDQIRHVIDFKWERFAKALFLRRMFLYLLMVLLYTVDTLYVWPVDSETYKSWESATVVRAIIEVVIYLLVFTFLWEEVQQMREEGFEYWKDVWNWLDLGNFGLLMALFPLRIAEKGNVAAIEALAAVVLWLRSLSYARGFRRTGRFVRIMFKIIEGMVFFMIVLLLVVIGFSHGFYLLHKDVHDNDFGSWYVLLRMYSIMLGELTEVKEFRDSRSEAMAIAFLVSYTLFVTIVLLNLLIALMGDIYGNVQQNATNEWLLERAKLVLELEHSLGSERITNASYFPTWVHVLKPTHEPRQLRVENRDLQEQLETLQEDVTAMGAQLQELTRMVSSIARANDASERGKSSRFLGFRNILSKANPLQRFKTSARFRAPSLGRPTSN